MGKKQQAKDGMKAAMREMTPARRKVWKRYRKANGVKQAWHAYTANNRLLRVTPETTFTCKGDSTGNEKPHHLRQVAQWLSQQFRHTGTYMLQFDGEGMDKTRIPLYRHDDGKWLDSVGRLIWDPETDPIPDDIVKAVPHRLREAKCVDTEHVDKEVDGVIDEALAKTVYEGAPKLGLGQFAVGEQFGTKIHESLEKYLGIYDGLPETALWENPVLDGLRTSAVVADWPKAFTIENGKVIIHPEAYRPDSDRTLERVLQRVDEMISDMAQTPPMTVPKTTFFKCCPTSPIESLKIDEEALRRISPDRVHVDKPVEMGVNDQPKPKPNDGASIHDLVMADVQQRKDFGLEKYGTLLQAGNLRDAIKDAYEEILDHVCYMRAYLEETKDTVVLTRDVAEAIERTLRVLAVEASKAADTADVMHFGKDPEGAPSAEEMHADRVSLAHSLILQAVSPKKGTDQKD